ncbi:Serine proteinase, partial [Meloidogyne graminicola]
MFLGYFFFVALLQTATEAVNCLDECGLSSSLFVEPEEPSFRSFGGMPIHAYPFSAIIYAKKDECDFYGTCSATIIGRNYILSAQHCLKKKSLPTKRQFFLFS